MSRRTGAGHWSCFIRTTLRADPRYAGTPFIVLTGRTRQDDMAEAFNAGFTDYIRKPFALPQVRARVRSWLARTAAHRV